MKTLFLLRHAKSGWKDSDLRDFDRPLTDRGKKAAGTIGRYMRKHDLRPELVVSSPAERARATVALVIEAARLPQDVRFDERIYEAHTGRLLEVVSQLDEQVQSAMLVGHNPGFEELAEHLTGQVVQMPTATLVQVDLDVEKWKQVRAGAGRLKRVIKPKELAE
jgi:phosphohistidine phosphatase